MNNLFKSFSLVPLLLLGALGQTACNKNDFENKRTIKKLYKRYKDGSISECVFQGQKVYCGDIGAYDAGYEIYNADGNKIGECSGWGGSSDAICQQLNDCEDIYIAKDNIWGRPPVDKYKLAH